MKWKRTTILAVIVLCVGILIYRSPNSTYELEGRTEEAIEMGRRDAFGLFTNSRFEVGSTSFEPANTKLENYDFTQAHSLPSMIQYVKEKHIIVPFSILRPENPENMELVALERFENAIVMTFGYMDNMDSSYNTIVEIPGKGKILVTIAVVYLQPFVDKPFIRYIDKFVRKIANLPVLEFFTGYVKAEGHWYLIDFKYTYNMNDYYSWILKEGEDYSDQAQVEMKEQMKYFKRPIAEIKKSIDEQSEKSINLIYDWIDLRMELQIKDIEKTGK